MSWRCACARCGAVTSPRCARTLSPAGGHTVRVRRKEGGRPLASPHGNYRGAGARRGRRPPAPRAFPPRLPTAAPAAKINTRRSHEATGPGPRRPLPGGDARRRFGAAPPRSPRGRGRVGSAGGAAPRPCRWGSAGPGPGEVRRGFPTCAGVAALRSPPATAGGGSGPRRSRKGPAGSQRRLPAPIPRLPAGGRPAAGGPRGGALKATSAPLGR